MDDRPALEQPHLFDEPMHQQTVRTRRPKAAPSQQAEVSRMVRNFLGDLRPTEHVHVWSLARNIGHKVEAVEAALTLMHHNDEIVWLGGGWYAHTPSAHTPWSGR